MADVKFIVSRLNDKPFEKRFTLVDFDEQSPIELLQLLNDLLESIDTTMKVNIRQEPETARSERIMNFLILLKYKDIPTTEDDRMDWLDGLGCGESQVIYPILQWILTVHNKLRKRAYLAPFLRPVEIPMEYLMQETGEEGGGGMTLSELAQRYRELQVKFKETHKRFEAYKPEMNEEPEQGSPLPPSSSSVAAAAGGLKKEIAQLEDEKRQLQERIEALKNKANKVGEISNNKKHAAFSTMLKATSQFRQEQDEEIRLQDRIRDQRHYLAVSEQKFNQTQQRLNTLRSSTTMPQKTGAGLSTAATTSTDHVLEEMKKEVKETNQIVRTDMFIEKQKLQERLEEVEKERMDPKRSESDVEDMQLLVSQLEDQCKEMRCEFDYVTKKKNESHDKLKMFKQHAKLARAKFQTKKQAMKEKGKELKDLQSYIKEMEEVLNDISTIEARAITGPDDRIMNRQEFKEYTSVVCEKEKRFNKAKMKLSDLQAESVVLQRTEQILKGRHQNIDEFLRNQEESAGIAGYRQAQNSLEIASGQRAEIDELKGQTLEEISVIVKNIAQTLEGKKAKLKPMIDNLKEKRKQAHELQIKHEEKKQRHDKLLQRLSSDRKVVESECRELHDEWLRQERMYHTLQSTNEIAQTNLDRVRLEDDWRSGKETFLPEFGSLRELYENKLTQQESFAKQLRKQQRQIKENEMTNVKQRAMFADLQKLLQTVFQCRKDICEARSTETDGIDINCLMNNVVHMRNDQVLTFD